MYFLELFSLLGFFALAGLVVLVVQCIKDHRRYGVWFPRFDRWGRLIQKKR